MAMEVVNCLLRDIPLPRMVEVRQIFDTKHLENPAGALRTELERDEVRQTLHQGMSIAVTAGSRGIDHCAAMLRELISFLKEQGTCPFIIPAMGSHGGACEEGQIEILTHYGITEEAMGCPIRATMEVQKIGVLEDGRPIYIDKYAAQADGIIAINRIKAHTAFRGDYESGVMKMLTIGLGKQVGAEVCHRDGIPLLGMNVEKFAFGILAHANVLLGIGIVENAFDRTYAVRVMTAAQIPKEEPELLRLSKSLMSYIKLKHTDVLVVDRIGKNISGEGMDPNVTGRWIVPSITGGIDATRLAVLGLTPESSGNFQGLGMADVCSRNVMQELDFDKSYANSLTSTVPSLCKIPMWCESQKLAIQAAVQMTPGRTPEQITMVRIADTLSLETVFVSENLQPLLENRSDIEIIGTPQAWHFDAQGNLF